MKYLIVLAILINGYMAGTDLDPFFEATPTRDHVVSTISVTNGGQWGSWMTAVYCPNGSFANGYAMKIAADRGGAHDDTLLNSMALVCADKSGTQQGIIVSHKGKWGTWTQTWKCSGVDTFFTGFTLQVHPPQGNWAWEDDTAANYVKFQCRGYSKDPSEAKTLESGRGTLGTFGAWSKQCPKDSAICGMTAKYEEWKLFTDSTAMNDVKFYCCGMPKEQKKDKTKPDEQKPDEKNTDGQGGQNQEPDACD